MMVTFHKGCVPIIVGNIVFSDGTLLLLKSLAFPVPWGLPGVRSEFPQCSPEDSKSSVTKASAFIFAQAVSVVFAVVILLKKGSAV